MSQTGIAAPDGDADFQPLIIYNCVHHREANPIDLLSAGTVEGAAQIYNGVLALQFGVPPRQMDNIHPLNFASAGVASLANTLNREVDALAGIARGDAQAQEVMLQNYESLAQAMVTNATASSTAVIATLGTLDAMIRDQSPATGIQRG